MAGRIFWFDLIGVIFINSVNNVELASLDMEVVRSNCELVCFDL